MSEKAAVQVGDKFRGVTGNLMVVTAIDGDRCRLRYLGRNDPEWWESSDELAAHLDRAETKPESDGAE